MNIEFNASEITLLLAALTERRERFSRVADNWREGKDMRKLFRGLEHDYNDLIKKVRSAE